MKALRSFLTVISMTIPVLANGEDGKHLFYVALQAEAKGNFDAAITSYERAADQAHTANLHGNLANLHFKVGHHGKAILHYRKALLLSPNDIELKANLARVMEIAEIPATIRSADDSYFAPSTIGTWCWSTAILFWVGLFAGIFVLRSLLSFYLKTATAVAWLTLVALGTYATWRADQNANNLFQEAVAIAPMDKIGENPNTIPLQRYAGNANSANAKLKSGESVQIDLDENATLKTHLTPDGTIWYLARSRSGGKKGWATNKQLIRLLD